MYYASFSTRKMIAYGLVMSYLTYLIPLYGGCPEYLLSALQTLQNRAARIVTKSSWFTPSSVMLMQVGWLNVRQMIAYHSLVLIFKTRQDRRPVYLYNQVSRSFNRNTRLAETNGINSQRRINSNLGKMSFLPRSVEQWNKLPPDIRSLSNILKFKAALKSWVKQNY